MYYVYFLHLILDTCFYSVLVVCHLAVLRCIFAYFMGTKLEDVPFQAFQRHTIYELKPGILLLILISPFSLSIILFFYLRIYLHSAMHG